MIYHSVHSDDLLWYLILRGKYKKTNAQLKTKFPIFSSQKKILSYQSMHAVYEKNL